MSCISLVVEDQADIRKLIRMTLEFENHEIHEVADAPSALTVAAALRPDLVLLDVMMPGEFDGLEACRRLRAEPGFGSGQSADIDAGLAAGADAYVLKPFSPLKLLETIHACLGAQAAAGAAR